MHPSFAAVLIVPPDKSMVLCFNQTSICLFESHTHGLQGGIIVTSSSENVSHYVKYQKGWLCKTGRMDYMAQT